MNTHSISIRRSWPGWIFLLAMLAVLTLGIAWRGAGRMMKMRTEAASSAEFAGLRAEDEAKIVLEITDVSAGAVEGGHVRGKLLEQRDETHYTRTANPVCFPHDTSAGPWSWGKPKNIGETGLRISGRFDYELAGRGRNQVQRRDSSRRSGAVAFLSSAAGSSRWPSP